MGADAGAGILGGRGLRREWRGSGDFECMGEGRRDRGEGVDAHKLFAVVRVQTV